MELHVQVLLSALAIVALAGVLGGFVFVITSRLQHVSNALGQIEGGVAAIENDTSILLDGADAINSNLNAAARNLTTAVSHAQALGA
jgi:uncharacterized protein YoxC